MTIQHYKNVISASWCRHRSPVRFQLRVLVEFPPAMVTHPIPLA
jgi:hypothetical protein